MNSPFRKISGVASVAGGIKWYLSEDCLLAAKRTMYVVQYRRFYLHELEFIMIWPRPSWRYRLVIPAVLLAALGIPFGKWINSTATLICIVLALFWFGLELALGPTAFSRIATVGAVVDLPILSRTRRAPKLLATINAAIRASREAAMPQATPALNQQPAFVSGPANSDAASTAPFAADPSQTNAI